MKRDGFNSQFGAMMAMIGSAVGLGSLWKFPYVAGQNGGAAFILIYILFLLILCMPLMLAEFVVGRRSKTNLVGAFKKLAPNTKWYLSGFLATLTSLIILSFYSVVGGWTIEYFISSVFSGIDTVASDKKHFQNFIGSPIRPILMHLLFLGATVGVLWTGVKNGIEKYSKLLMPLLFIMVVGLAIFSMSLPNAHLGIEFMMLPKFEDVTSTVILEALGMGLFTLSLGMGIVITYSSYLSGKENLVKISLITIVMDVIFALLAGLMILPAVFAFGFQPDEGPGLLFIILPKVFAQIPFGSVLSAVFFVVVFIASLTSSISLLEVVIAYMSEEWKISRKKTLIIVGVVLTITGSLCSLSLGNLSYVKIFGKTIFDFADSLTSTFLMPLCAFLISLFVGWKMERKDVLDELSNGGTLKLRLFNLFMILLRYFVPLAIIIIFLNQLGVFGFLAG
jgi:NSS family neurotransmitter:Na+ symporter